MILQAFAVYDAKARCFATPFFFKHEDLALRAFASACNDPQIDLFRHPEDFSLWQIGTFDDEKGTLIPLGININLGMAAQFKGVPNAS